MTAKIYPPVVGAPAGWPIDTGDVPSIYPSQLPTIFGPIDPGAVGAGFLWVDTSSGPPYTLNLRDSGNTGWDAVGSTGSVPDIAAVLAAGDNAGGENILGLNIAQAVEGKFADLFDSVDSTGLIGEVPIANGDDTWTWGSVSGASDLATVLGIGNAVAGQNIIGTAGGSGATGAVLSMPTPGGNGGGTATLHGGLRNDALTRYGQVAIGGSQADGNPGGVEITAGQNGVGLLVGGPNAGGSGQLDIVAANDRNELRLRNSGNIKFLSNSDGGASGKALVSSGVGDGGTVWGGIYAIAAGVPTGAPDGKLPIAVDTTAVSGGIYVWDGAAWQKAASI